MSVRLGSRCPAGCFSRLPTSVTVWLSFGLHPAGCRDEVWLPHMRRRFGSATSRTRTHDTLPTLRTPAGLGSPAAAPLATRRSRQGGAPHRTNDLEATSAGAHSNEPIRP